MTPSNQFELPSKIKEFVMKTATKMTAVSYMLKYKLIGTSMNQPTRTKKGVTKMAICKEEPMATPIAKSILL